MSESNGLPVAPNEANEHALMQLLSQTNLPHYQLNSYRQQQA